MLDKNNSIVPNFYIRTRKILTLIFDIKIPYFFLLNTP